MRKSILMMTAAASLVASAALAQTPPAGGAMMGGAMMGGAQFSQEERAMQFLDRKGKTDAQIADMRTKQRAMSPAEQVTYKADLDSRWAKLGAKEKSDAIAAMTASFQGGASRPGGAATP